MDLKEFWSKTNRWVRARKFSNISDYSPELDTEGLIAEQTDTDQQQQSQQQFSSDGQVLVKTINQGEKAQSLEKVNTGFEKLVGQLQQINENLNEQVSQHHNLMEQIEKMPRMLEAMPSIVADQQQLTSELIEQLKSKSAKEQQFTEAVERIPNETVKQTDALVSINHQLAASADTEVQIAEGLNKFNQNLEKLDQSCMSQTESIIQMSKTFATSDRYLKYLVGRQNRRFMWIFVSAICVCVFAILLLAGIIIYLLQ